eukprot:3391312-Amphidinium_carterae.1
MGSGQPWSPLHLFTLEAGEIEQGVILAEYGVEVGFALLLLFILLPEQIYDEHASLVVKGLHPDVFAFRRDIHKGLSAITLALSVRFIGYRVGLEMWTLLATEATSLLLFLANMRMARFAILCMHQAGHPEHGAHF